VLARPRNLQAAGCFALVPRTCAAEFGCRPAAALAIPVIGIGAGDDCDGQVAGDRRSGLGLGSRQASVQPGP